MDEKLQTNIGKIRQYISAHPQIKIEKHSIIIPTDCKQAFYSIFKQIREDTIIDRYPILFRDAQLLGEKYSEIEHLIAYAHCNANSREVLFNKYNTQKVRTNFWQRIIRRLNNSKFGCIMLDAQSDEYLHYPLAAMSRVLYDPLFAFLQGKTDGDELQDSIDKIINTEFERLYRTCYQTWILLNLLKLLEVDSLYSVLSPEMGSKAVLKRTISM
jgi:hypothetical protein